MAGNPRKFSEKIAIHQRKLNEEQNAFASIIAEVSSITRGGEASAAQPAWGPGTSAGGFFGAGVNESISGQHAPMTQPCGRSPGASIGHPHHSHIYHPYRSVSPHRLSPAGHSPERPQLSPPYPGAHMFLVPPQDTNWRRAHSDPGIHASVMHPPIPGVQMGAHQAGARTSGQGGISPPSERGQCAVAYFLEPKLNPPQYRPRSCDNVPNISIQPSEPVAGPQVPISTSTGSLPDLPSTLLPPHLQQLEGVLTSQAPLYAPVSAISTSMDAPGSSSGPCPPSISLQQRHSIQLPVQYSQGVFVGGTSAGPRYTPYGMTGMESLGSQSYPHPSPYYQPESPRSSAPTSPNDGAVGSDDSPTSPQTQVQSPGSPYYSLHTKIQNVNIDSEEPVIAGQNAPLSILTTHDQVSMPVSTVYQQYPAVSADQLANFQHQYREEMYQALLLRQQVQQQHQYPSTTMAAQAEPLQQPMGPQSSGQIPDIIFTGADGSTSGAGGVAPNLNPVSNYIDPTMEMLSSDLRVSLDPVDLESLHGLNSEQGLNIDAASEDALRRDRL